MRIFDYACEVCGTIIIAKYHTKPKLYCSDNCRNYNKYKNALERTLIALNPTAKASKLIRGDLFRLANSLRIGTKSLEVKK